MNIYNIKSKKLDIFKIPLHGINLIEASAGTGKTSTIVLLYLRLLLGIENKKNNIKKFLIHEILVVTFTNAAKEELYIRIKNSIKNLYLSCIDKKNNNDFFSILLLKEIKDIDEAAHILQTAYNNINNASIYTIHGFCQKILQSQTFYINYIFEEKIIENENNLYIQATQDFWRSYFYNLPENIIKIISTYYNGPDALLKEIQPLLYIKSINFKKKNIMNKKLIVHHKQNIQEINNFKIIWLKNYQYISKKINNLNINKKIYNKINLAKWIDNITIWAKSITENYQIPTSLKYFKKTHIEKNMKNNIILEDIIFIKIEEILKKKYL